jgi:RIO-like serine/threonine protein kinase
MVLPTGVTSNLVRIFLEQILKALKVLTAASIIHCDLKPENILLLTPKYASPRFPRMTSNAAPLQISAAETDRLWLGLL